jgi:hypothetical protein
MNPEEGRLRPQIMTVLDACWFGNMAAERLELRRVQVLRAEKSIASPPDENELQCQRSKPRRNIPNVFIPDEIAPYGLRLIDS